MFLVGSASCQTLVRADRPDIKVGDTWVYQGADLATGEKRQPVTSTVESVLDDRMVFQTGEQSETYTRELNMMEIRRGNSPTFSANPFWARYQFPLEVGKQWEGKFDTVSRGGERGYRWQWKVKVEGVESITVPAGTFEAIKLRLDGFYTCSRGCDWSGRRTETIWYAPVVKRHVKTEFEETSGRYRDSQRFELLSFKPAP